MITNYVKCFTQTNISGMTAALKMPVFYSVSDESQVHQRCLPPESGPQCALSSE